MFTLPRAATADKQPGDVFPLPPDLAVRTAEATAAQTRAEAKTAVVNAWFTLVLRVGVAVAAFLFVLDHWDQLPDLLPKTPTLWPLALALCLPSVARALAEPLRKTEPQ